MCVKCWKQRPANTCEELWFVYNNDDDTKLFPIRPSLSSGLDLWTGFPDFGIFIDGISILMCLCFLFRFKFGHFDRFIRPEIVHSTLRATK